MVSVSKRLPVCGRGFFDELELSEVRLDDLFEIPAWQHQTGSSIPERCLMFLTIGPTSGGRQRSGKHVDDTGNSMEIEWASLR